MADKTGIEWTDATWNPIRGCSRVSEGCRNCYAESVANRFKGEGQPYHNLIAKGGQWNGQIKLVPHLLDQPLRWTKPRRIFVNSMSDLFHENVPFEFIDRIFAVMALCPQHTFQILTKRPARMREYLSDDSRFEAVSLEAVELDAERSNRLPDPFPWPLPNVWMGVSVENQATANERIPLLLQTPAAVRWVSAEPLLGPVDLTNIEFIGTRGGLESWDALDLHGTENASGHECMATLDWLVVGGESGAGARPMHPGWVRSLRDQCQKAGTPFLFKQVGQWAWASHTAGPREITHAVCQHGRVAEFMVDAMKNACIKCATWECASWEGLRPTGKKSAGRTLDGRTWTQFPEATAPVPNDQQPILWKKA